MRKCVSAIDHGVESLRSYSSTQLVKKFHTFYGTRRFITVFTGAGRFQSPVCNISKQVAFCLWGIVIPSPNPQVGGPYLVGCRDCQCITFAATLHIWRPYPPSAGWGRAIPWWQGPT